MFIFFLVSLYLPIEDWTYSYLDELKVRHENPLVFMHTLPFEHKRVLEKIKMISETTTDSQIQAISQKLIQHLGKYHLYLKPMFLSDSTSRVIADLGAKGTLNDFSAELEIRFKYGRSQEYPPIAWPGNFGIDQRRAYGCYRHNGFEVLFGRQPLKWGPSPGPSLLVSGESPPFNLFWTSYEHKNIKGTFFFSPLDPYAPDTGKYFCAHRLDLSLFNNRFLFGFSEAIIFCRQDLFSGIGYLNPFSIYRITEYNYNYSNTKMGAVPFNDDLYSDFDFAWYIKKMTLYGELLIDDPKLDFSHIESMLFLKDMLDSGPIGFIFGLKWCDFPFSKSYSIIQYTRVNSYTYYHYYVHNYYIYMGYPIGHPEGPDFDRILYSLTYHYKKNCDLNFNLNFDRHGKARLKYGAETPPRNYFLWGKEQGLVEYQADANLGLSLFFTPRLTLKGEGGTIWIKNYMNQKGINKWFPNVKLYLELYI